jgi:UDP-N-acetylmuramoyl-L-alanyl-D-glutamate--2,6-diaminopimelate ligase
MQLSELIAGLPVQAFNLKDIEISAIEFDSRKIKTGAIYIALKGARFDGHDFVVDAEEKGAVAVITQERVETALPQVVVKCTRAILGTLAKRFYGDFSKMTKVGITGTNGKTTTSFLIHSILKQAGRNPGLIGTIYYQGSTKTKAVRTTPEILDIMKLLRAFETDGIDSLVMEVSSHALKLRRVEEIAFDVAVFTNLTQDHLDFHKTMDDYRNSKLHIFTLLKENGYGVYNGDEESGQLIRALPIANKISFGVQTESDITARILDASLSGSTLEISCDEEIYRVSTSLIGGFNVYNILAAFASGVALGLEREDVVKGIEGVKSVRGRLERIVDNVFVDFAHTPSAIEKILETVKQHARGRVIIVFGCGGDRDRDKRPKMGTIASGLADLAVITSDNPRCEPPKQIIDDIMQGVVGNNHKIIEDRAAAIQYAIAAKEADDVVIVAGKGHEEYQIVNEERFKFNDTEVIRKCFASSC